MTLGNCGVYAEHVKDGLEMKSTFNTVWADVPHIRLKIRLTFCSLSFYVKLFNLSSPSVGRLVEPWDPDVWASDGSISFYLGGREKLPEWGVKVSVGDSTCFSKHVLKS